MGVARLREAAPAFFTDFLVDFPAMDRFLP